MGQSMGRQGRPSTPEPFVFNSASGTAKKEREKKKRKEGSRNDIIVILTGPVSGGGVNKNDPRFAGTEYDLLCTSLPLSFCLSLFRTLLFCPGQYPCLRCVSCASLLRAPDGEEPSCRFFFCDSGVFFP